MQSDAALNRRAVWLGLCCILAVTAYVPALNNGFVGDDYAILKRIEILKMEPLFLYRVPPENFRFVSYVVFAAIKGLVGYQASAFYAFNIGLHIANTLLLWRFLKVVIPDERTVGLAALLFAVFQAPQEAVMWLAAMNETTLFFFTLLTLLAWSQKRFGVAALAYFFALFSKESAVIIPMFVLLFDWYSEHRLLWRKYIFLLVPSIGFAVLFFVTLSQNFMLTNRSYSLHPGAILVVAKSLHRLIWPWMYIVIAITWLKTRMQPSWRQIAIGLGGVILTMLPYMFITYQTNLPSRQLYLASAVFMTTFAVLLRPLAGSSLHKVFVCAFVAFNIGYLWFRKDGQFEERAAPTTQLIALLKANPPQPTVIENFPYPYPEIPKSAALLVPGWNESLISLDAATTPCPDCWCLRWNTAGQRYDVVTRP
jgi:hypothetical protein